MAAFPPVRAHALPCGAVLGGMFSTPAGCGWDGDVHVYDDEGRDREREQERERERRKIDGFVIMYRWHYRRGFV